MPGRRKSPTGILRFSSTGRSAGVERVGDDAEAPDRRRRGRPLDVAARLLHRLLLAHVDPHRVRRAARVEERQRALDRHPGLHPRAELVGLLRQLRWNPASGSRSSPSRPLPRCS